MERASAPRCHFATVAGRRRRARCLWRSLLPSVLVEAAADHLGLAEGGGLMVAPGELVDLPQADQPGDGDQPQGAEAVAVEKLHRVEAGPRHRHEPGRDRQSHRPGTEATPGGPGVGGVGARRLGAVGAPAEVEGGGAVEEWRSRSSTIGVALLSENEVR